MADKFRALLVTKDGNRQSVAVTELTDADLMEGDVTVAVEHSTVNYKDGLAITGKAPIIRKFPLMPNVQEREMVLFLASTFSYGKLLWGVHRHPNDGQTVHRNRCFSLA